MPATCQWAGGRCHGRAVSGCVRGLPRRPSRDVTENRAIFFAEMKLWELCKAGDLADAAAALEGGADPNDAEEAAQPVPHRPCPPKPNRTPASCERGPT